MTTSSNAVALATVASEHLIPAKPFFFFCDLICEIVGLWQLGIFQPRDWLPFVSFYRQCEVRMRNPGRADCRRYLSTSTQMQSGAAAGCGVTRGLTQRRLMRTDKRSTAPRPCSQPAQKGSAVDSEWVRLSLAGLLSLSKATESSWRRASCWTMTPFNPAPL